MFENQKKILLDLPFLRNSCCNLRESRKLHIYRVSYIAIKVIYWTLDELFNTSYVYRSTFQHIRAVIENI